MLSTSLGEATDDHPLAQFSSDPVSCIGEDKDGWEKFNGPLDTVLQKQLEELWELVRVGDKGLMGLHHLFEYLVIHHGIQGGLIKNKIERLMQAMDEVSVVIQLKTYDTTNLMIRSLSTTAGMLEVINCPQLEPSSPIDVDSLPDPLDRDACVQHHSSGVNLPILDVLACIGVMVDVTPGKSVHSTYPFGLHNEIGDPWTYSITNGTLILHA